MSCLLKAVRFERTAWSKGRRVCLLEMIGDRAGGTLVGARLCGHGE